MLSSDELQSAIDWIRVLADQLGLKDWEIILLDVPCESDCGAMIHITDSRKIATIKLCVDFMDFSAESQRRMVVHELLHCHFHGAHKVIETLSAPLGGVGYYIAEANHREQIELATDAIAGVIAEFYPAWIRKVLDGGDLQSSNGDTKGGQEEGCTCGHSGSTDRREDHLQGQDTCRC